MTESCYFCGEIECIETHHIVPRRFDGSDKDENLVDVCPTCHSKLESLYDKRFYDELDVRKNTNTTIDEGCFAEDCMADAVKYVNEDAVYSFPVCDKHNECGYGDCEKQPIDTTYGEGVVFKFCDEHNECRRSSCGSSDIRVYEHEYIGKIRLCIDHIAEEEGEE